MMKNQLLSLCFIVASLVACNDSDDFTPEIDVTPIHTVSNHEQILKIPISSNTDWELIKERSTWCVLNKLSGAKNDTIILRIAENIDYKERKISIGIGNPSASKIIQIIQQAATEEYHYKLPVIFHIFHDDPSKPHQNVDSDVITKAIEAVNAYYRNSVNSVDMNIEFVLATHDPEGNLLQEPGVERIYSTTSTKASCREFMMDPEIVPYIWDLNRYINICTFSFIETDILGVSSFPFTVGHDPLVGLDNGDLLFYYPTLIWPQCIALNNYYILTEHSLMFIQDLHLTLAHEFGHYLGLLHVFNEDYCDDTETYDRDSYKEWLYSMEGDPCFEELAKRTSYTGTSFVSCNIMDYDYSYLNQFTQDQRKRVRHVLENSPLIPGPKHTDDRTRSTRSTEIPQQRFTH